MGNSVRLSTHQPIYTQFKNPTSTQDFEKLHRFCKMKILMLLTMFAFVMAGLPTHAEGHSCRDSKCDQCLHQDGKCYNYATKGGTDCSEQAKEPTNLTNEVLGTKVEGIKNEVNDVRKALQLTVPAIQKLQETISDLSEQNERRFIEIDDKLSQLFRLMDWPPHQKKFYSKIFTTNHFQQPT